MFDFPEPTSGVHSSSTEASLVPVYLSIYPPSPPLASGSLWYNTSTTQLSVWVPKPEGGVWEEVDGESCNRKEVFSSISPPSDPSNGTLWYNPSTRSLKIWSTDGINYLWREITSSGECCQSPALVSDSEPLNPVEGLLWYKPSDHSLKVWVISPGGPEWQVISEAQDSCGKPTVSVSSVAPGNPSEGDLWWNPSLQEFRVWVITPSGGNWSLISDNTPQDPLPPVYISIDAPYRPKIRYLWFNPQNLELKVWDGLSWLMISKTIPEFLNYDGSGKVNGSLLYYNAGSGGIKADGNFTVYNITDGGNF